VLLLEAARWWSAAKDARAQLLWQELVADGDRDTSARARLELAHMMRRVGDLVQAIAAYEALALDVAMARPRRDSAMWWCGRTYELLGDIEAAERTWTRLAHQARDPCLRVRAWDRLGRSYLARGALKNAREAALQCVQESAEFSAESTPLGARVRAAIGSMTLRRRLADQAR
jgi:tetratricopeptide (TPR) repeat protein